MGAIIYEPTAFRDYLEKLFFFFALNDFNDEQYSVTLTVAFINTYTRYIIY